MATTSPSTLNMSGSGFYPNGSVNLLIKVSDGSVSTYSMTADANGNVSTSVQLANVTNIGTTSQLSVFAQDVTTGADSNTITIPVNAPPTPVYGIVRIPINGGQSWDFIDGVLLNAAPGTQVSSYQGVPIYSAGTPTSGLAVPYLILIGRPFTVPKSSSSAVGGGSYTGQLMDTANLTYQGSPPF